jgi:hypothetical protein
VGDILQVEVEEDPEDLPQLELEDLVVELQDLQMLLLLQQHMLLVEEVVVQDKAVTLQ